MTLPSPSPQNPRENDPTLPSEEEDDLPSLSPAAIPYTPNIPVKKRTTQPKVTAIPLPEDSPNLESVTEDNHLHRRETPLGPAHEMPILSADDELDESTEAVVGTNNARSALCPDAVSHEDTEKNAADLDSENEDDDDDEDEDDFEDDPDEDDVVEAEPEKPSGMAPTERLWMVFLALGLCAVLGLTYSLMREALPGANPSRVVEVADLPIKGEFVTIDALELRWRRVNSTGDEGIRSGMLLVPEIKLTCTPSSNGALRVFFRDDRNTQAGDTLSLKIVDGKIENMDATRFLNSSVGLATQLEYDDLRSREDKAWKAEILESEDPLAPISEFKLLGIVQIPWNLKETTLP